MAGDELKAGALTEADTCRLFVTPALHAAGWGQAPAAIGEQRSFTDGRIAVSGGIVRRGRQKRADYILFHRRDFPIAVVEAKEAVQCPLAAIEAGQSLPAAADRHLLEPFNLI